MFLAGMAVLIKFLFRTNTDNPKTIFPALFLFAYLLIIIGTAISAKVPSDLLYALDFLPLAVGAGLCVALLKVPRSLLIKVVAYSSLVGLALGLAVGVAQTQVYGMSRATGLGGSAIFFGTLSVLLGFLTLLPLFTRKRFPLILIAGPFIAITNALLSGTRSTLIAATVLLAIWLVFFLSDRRRATAWPAVAISVIVAVVGAGLGAFLGDWERILSFFSVAYELFETGKVLERSTALRLDFYQAGLQTFLNNPWSGHGWHQAFAASEPYRILDDHQPHLHNDLLNFAVAYGVIGIVAYFFIVGAPILNFFYSSEKDRAVGYFLCCLVATYVATGLLDVNFYYEAPKVLYCLLAGVLAACCLPQESETRHKLSSN